MKMYMIAHQWLSHKQNGIQGAHSIVEMVGDHAHKDDFFELYNSWSNDHKTIIMLQGGGSGYLLELEERLQSLANDGIELFPTIFREDEYSLDCAVTSLAFLANEKMLAVMDAISEPHANHANVMLDFGITTDSLDLIRDITRMRLV